MLNGFISSVVLEFWSVVDMNVSSECREWSDMKC